MSVKGRVVLDNNVILSGLLFPNSAPGRALQKATHLEWLLISEAFIAELAIVLARSKFDRFISLDDRKAFLRTLDSVCERVDITHCVYVCRDPTDNMILELAIDGRADFVVTGDKDLLSLGNIQRIPIVTPASYVGS